MNYEAELRRLSLLELIERYTRAWHRAAQQPGNAEVAQQRDGIQKMIRDRWALAVDSLGPDVDGTHVLNILDGEQ